MKSRKRKHDAPKPIEEMAVTIDKLRRRRIGAACTVLRAGLKVEQLLQWIYSRERKVGEAVSRSWEEWGATLKCHPVTAKRNAQKALDLGLLQYSEGLTRFGGDSKNRFAIDWEGINEALGIGTIPPNDRGAKCAGEGSILLGGGEQNAHAFKEVTLLVSLDPSLSTTSTMAPGESLSSSDEFSSVRHNPAEAFDMETIAAVEIAGVGKASEFTREAIARGDDPRAIVEAYNARAKAWKAETRVYILIDRLRKGRQCGADAGWPAADYPHLMPTAPKAPKTPANEPAGESTKDSTARLEATHGANLDAISFADRVALLSESEKQFHEATVRRGGARWLLLPKLEARQGGSTPIEVGASGFSSNHANARDGDFGHYDASGREVCQRDLLTVAQGQRDEAARAKGNAGRIIQRAILGPCPGGVR